MALSRALADGNYDPLVDPRLDGDFDQTEAARIVACAAASIRHAGRQRPKMSQVRCYLTNGTEFEFVVMYQTELNSRARFIRS